MIIELKTVFEIPGYSEEFSGELESEELALTEGYEMARAAEIKGTVKNCAGIVTLEYEARFTLGYSCGRCLKECEKEYALKFEHLLVRELSGDNDDGYIVVEDSALDITNLAAEDIILELPAVLLCRDDCKGLCQKCGKNRNEEECSCESGYVDPRLQKLRDLLN